MANKPYEGQDCGGAVFNYPLAYDAQTGVDQVTSPIAGSATEKIFVHAMAGRLNLLVSGSAAATVTVYKGVTAQPGSITIPPGVQTQIDTGGMGIDSPNIPFQDSFQIVAGADSPVSFWFDSTTPTGTY